MIQSFVFCKTPTAGKLHSLNCRLSFRNTGLSLTLLNPNSYRRFNRALWWLKVTRYDCLRVQLVHEGWPANFCVSFTKSSKDWLMSCSSLLFFNHSDLFSLNALVYNERIPITDLSARLKNHVTGQSIKQTSLCFSWIRVHYLFTNLLTYAGLTTV